MQGGSTNAYTTCAAITPTTAICAFRGLNSDGFAGTLTLTPTPVISGQLVGIASTSATNGATASVDVGPLVTGTYTSGADYYVSGAGGLTTNATPVHVLKAKSTTEGVLDLRGNPGAGRQQTYTYVAGNSGTLTIPSGVSEFFVELCAGGGSGASGGSPSTGASGGGGGAYLSSLIQVVSGVTSAAFSVGAGGAGSGSTSGQAGGSTTLTYNGITYTCAGGSGGAVATCSRSSGGLATISSVSRASCVAGACGFNTAVDSSATGIGGNSALGQGSVGANAPTGYGSGSGGVYSGTTEKGAGGIIRVQYTYG
jgi:hypothetical protein